MEEAPTVEPQVSDSATEQGEPTASPAEPQATEESAIQPQAEDKKEWTVPGDRFQEEVEKRKELETKLAQLETQSQPAVEETPDTTAQIDPDTEKLLEGWAKKQGFVSKSELEAERAERQFDADARDLESHYKDFDRKKVVEYATSNNMPITSKAALEAAYFLQNKDAILERERNAAIESARSSGTFAEAPTGGGAKLTPEQKKDSESVDLDHKDYQSKIRSIRQKLQQ